MLSNPAEKLVTWHDQSNVNSE